MNVSLYIATRRGLYTCLRKEGRWSVVEKALQDTPVTSLSFEGTRILAGTKDGVFASDSVGKPWHRSSSGMTIRHVRWLERHPDQPGLIFAGTEPAGIFVSRDGGETWHGRIEVEEQRDRRKWYLPYSPLAGCVRGFSFNGDRGYGAAEVGGILRSDDRGDTWYLVGDGGGTSPPEGEDADDVHSVEVHPTSPDLVFAATGGGLFRSLNGGKSWAALYDCYCRDVWVDPENADRMIFSPATRKGWHGTVLSTGDGGKTWEGGAGGLEVPWFGKMVERFARAGDEIFAVRSDGALYVSPLTHLTWSPFTPHIEGVSAVRSISLA